MGEERMKRKAFWLTMISAIGLLIMSGCGTESQSTKKAEKSKEDKLVLNFGVMPAVDSLPVYIAEKEGYFKEEGLELGLESFKSPKDRDAALTSGNLDGANTDLIAVSAYHQGDLDIKIVSQSIGTFSVLTSNPEVKQLADLKGKTVGYMKNQAPTYFLDEALKKENLSINDINYEEVPQIPVRVELTIAQKLDATVVPEPFRTIGLANGLTELANSNEMDIQTTVLGFSNEALTENKEAVEAFYKAYNKGVDYINSHEMADYYDVLKDQIGFSDEIKDRVTLPKYVHAKQIDTKQVENALEWSKEQGIDTKGLTTKEVLSPFLADNDL